MNKLNCFKTYDIRGIVPDEFNVELAYKIGRAYATFLKPNKVVIGHDIRLSGPDLCIALAKGLTDTGVNVIHISQCGTEEIYFSVPHLNADGGICVTASHNPANYNGMKLIKKGALPIGQGSGLQSIKKIIFNNTYAPLVSPTKQGRVTHNSTLTAYIDKLLSFVELGKLKPIKIVANAGNGGAGIIVNALENNLPFTIKKLNFNPDGRFPNGVPNPLLIENRSLTAKAVIEEKADIGIAWDGDFDRCFFFDERGEFVEGYYIVALLADYLLKNTDNETIIYDPRLYWNTQKVIDIHQAKGVKSQTGHVFMKEAMRRENALYGGEMSAHHYFRDFYYCDNGNIPWLIMAQILSSTNKTLSTLIADYMNDFPCSGEINLSLSDPNRAMQSIELHYQADCIETTKLDGLSMAFSQWRFNIRCSNTEPLLRVNIETRNNATLLKEKTAEIVNLLNNV